MKPVKLGIIGCGIAARELHWPALQKLQDKFEIPLVCNHTEPKAKDFAELVGGVPYVLDYRELLQSPEVEAVDIVLPIPMNYQVTRDALRAGKHVLVEKPLAANLSQARKMLVLEKRYPLVMMVAENFRYRPTFYRLKAYLDQGQIGKPYAVFWNVFYRLDRDDKYARTQWRIHHQYPGGFITDGGVHNIAALRFLFGEIISGTAFTKSINPDIGELDTMSFQFATTDNVHGVFNVFFSTNGYLENRILILGNQGSIIVENNKIILKKTGQADQEKIVEDDGGYQGEFENFYGAIRTGQKVISSFSEAYRDLWVIIRALNTAKKFDKISFRPQLNK